MTAEGSPARRWCGKLFNPRRDGGRARRFCDERCRRALDGAGRQWIADTLKRGMLTVADIKNGPAATRALLPAAASPSAAPEEGSGRDAHQQAPQGLFDGIDPLLLALLSPDELAAAKAVIRDNIEATKRRFLARFRQLLTDRKHAEKLPDG